MKLLHSWASSEIALELSYIFLGISFHEQGADAIVNSPSRLCLLNYFYMEGSFTPHDSGSNKMFQKAVGGAAAAPPAGLGATAPPQLLSRGICSYLQTHEKVRLWGLVWGWAGNPRFRICPFPGTVPFRPQGFGGEIKNPKLPVAAACWKPMWAAPGVNRWVVDSSLR